MMSYSEAAFVRTAFELVQREKRNSPSSVAVFLKTLDVILPRCRCQEERLGTFRATVFLINLALRDVIVAVVRRGYLTFSILRKRRALIS